MTGLVVAEPQPLWLSLQHTPPSEPSLEISDAPADVAVGAGDVLVDVVDVPVGIADLAVELADSAELPYLQPHLFPFQFPSVGKV